MTGASAKNLILNDLTVTGDSTSSYVSSDGSNATIDIGDTRSTVNVSNGTNTVGTNTFSGASGNVTWNSIGCSYTFKVVANCPTFTMANYNTNINTLGQSNFLTTSASTSSGFISNFSCDFINVGSVLFNIGNAAFTYTNTYCAFNGDTTYTLANSQQANSVLTLVNGGTTSQGLVYADAKTGFQGSYYFQKQAFLHTTSASAQTLITVAVPSNSSICVQGILTAQNATFTDATGGSFLVFAQNDAGTVNIIGTPLFNGMASTTGTMTFVVSGTNLLIKVTAPSIAAYNWGATYQFMPIFTNN